MVRGLDASHSSDAESGWARLVGPLERITPGFIEHAEGSVLVEFGQTRVLCTASVEERVPPHKKGSGEGWVTAEYGMLPRSTHERMAREAARGKQGGRTLEIQRLVGRALRAAMDLRALGPRTITIDCDVVQADGGTRTAAITGGWVALALAVRKLRTQKKLPGDPVRRHVAAVSVGVLDGEVRLDLDYDEDSTAEVDMNVVMTGSGDLVEVQATAEGKTFTLDKMNDLIAVARGGIEKLLEVQKSILKTDLLTKPKA